MSKAEALSTIKELISDFELNKSYYLSKEFLENHCEEKFIKPFIKALGWDLESKGIAGFLREVITQDRVKTGKTKKAPDYGFGLPGNDKRLFYLEAKAPSVKIKTDKDPAFQLRRYGRSGQTPVSILFNFSEFAVYDCTKKQSSTDSASFARNIYLTYEQYVDNFDFIYNTFSREAVYSGSFHKYTQSDTQKKGNVTLDKDFVESLNEWRLKLAKSIAKNNFKYNEEEINHAVQLLLDRIIFLRFCEERDVEPMGQLQAVANSANVYKHLFDLFYDADKKYNSGLFHFEDGCVTENLKLDDKAIKEIIDDLYPPKSDYAFSLFPVEILGNAYEQFLGKTIRITAGHSVKIEDKPEVRKAGGVYYTPQYIVDYIVQNTVGKLIEGKTPKEIEKIKIVDPACGSGSFLLGAYKYLLLYHQKYYYNKNAKSKELNENGTLNTAEKRKILTNNIFGVDLDENAVEVSKLSLLLKCMEGETASTVKQQLTMYHTRVLPDLDKNIVNGNSLIGYDFFDGELALDKEQRKEIQHKIKPFEWKVAFPQVFKQGGFDAVIGNPPYVGRSTSFEDKEKNYIKNTSVTSEGKYELYQLFIEKSSKIANSKNSYVSLITPQTWLSIIQATKLRKYLLTKFSLEEIIFLGKEVFSAAVDTIIFIYKTGSPTKSFYFKEGKDLQSKENEIPIKKIFFKEISKENFIIPISVDEVSTKIINKISKDSIKLNELGSWSDGVKVVGPAKDFAFQTKKFDKSFYPMYSGSDIEKYVLQWGGLYCCRDKEKIKKHNATDIRLRAENVFNKIKIIIRKTGNKIIASIDEKNYYYEQSLFSFSLKNNIIDLKIILAILNSNTGDYILKANAFSKKETFPQIRLHWLKEFPIPNIKHFTKELENKIVEIIDLICQLKKELQQTTNPKETETIKKQITYHENKIDELVYDLYELTPEEILIIENA